MNAQCFLCEVAAEGFFVTVKTVAGVESEKEVCDECHCSTLSTVLLNEDGKPRLKSHRAMSQVWEWWYAVYRLDCGGGLSDEVLFRGASHAQALEALKTRRNTLLVKETFKGELQSL